MIERPPITLNPRRATDALSQKLDALMFRGLTRINAQLEAEPDLAARWKILDGGKTWIFPIQPGLKDHGGETISAERIASCLENYMTAKPATPFRGSFPGWTQARAENGAVWIELSRPNPYLARNVSLFRYFRVEGDSHPCIEPSAHQAIIGSGMYRQPVWNPAPESQIMLTPFEPVAEGRPPLEIQIVGDDNTRVIKLLRGEVDVAAPYTVSLTKSRWLTSHYPDRFELLETEGVSVSYLAFNLRDPILSQKAVRQAIALAIPRDLIVKNKFLNSCQSAGSLLSARLPESLQTNFAYDPQRAEVLLDSAGFRRPSPGASRFTLHYRTTPVREGFETGLMIQDVLRKIGIKVSIESVEPAVFLASIKKGAFQLYSSRWIGISDASILYRTLRAGQLDNRVGYDNSIMNDLLDRAITEIDLDKRRPLMQKAQALMAEDLPYFPLWFWNNSIIIRKGLTGLQAKDLSLSGAYEPLTHLRREPPL